MAQRIRVAARDELADRHPRTLSAGRWDVAVVRLDDQVVAFEDRCPHRDARLSPGPIHDSTIQCPLHAWEFDLLSGACRSGAPDGLTRFEVFVSPEGDVFVELPDEVQQTWDRIHRYLVRYGSQGWVERVGSVERIRCRRGDDVVIQTSRGLEAATVLAGPEALGSGPDHQPTGELVRVMTLDDQVRLKELTQPTEAWIDQAAATLRDHSAGVEIADAERLFDDQTVVLYYLGELARGELAAPVTQLTETLSSQLGCRILLHPLIEPAGGSGGCGAGGCGNGGCGSSAGTAGPQTDEHPAG